MLHFWHHSYIARQLKRSLFVIVQLQRRFSHSLHDRVANLLFSARAASIEMRSEDEPTHRQYMGQFMEVLLRQFSVLSTVRFVSYTTVQCSIWQEMQNGHGDCIARGTGTSLYN